MKVLHARMYIFWLFLFCTIRCIEYEPLREKELQRCLRNPAVVAFLDTIAYSEGTFNQNGYRTCFTGVLFSNFVDHPRMRHAKRSFCSDAAGRYQFLSSTWDYISKKMGLKNFQPRNQDRAALQLIYERSALDDLKKGRFPLVLKKTASVWASFPDAPYGQPTQRYADLATFYKKRLHHYNTIFVERGGAQ